MTENEKKLKQLEKLISKPNVDAKLKPIYQMGINKLKEKIEKEKPIAVVTKKEKVAYLPVSKMPKTTKPKTPQKSKVERVGETVVIDGVTYDMDSKEFCDYLVAEFKKRRASLKAQQKSKSKISPIIEKLKNGLVVRFEENKGGRNVSNDMFFDADTDEIILFTEITMKSGKKSEREVTLTDAEASDKYAEIKNNKNITIDEFYE
jgi:polyhydroxyalkanoate synthesis regulator phasin